MKTPVADWLERDFTEWQAGLGVRKTRAEYAALLEVSESTYKNWLHKGTMPTLENVIVISSKRGPGIYDAMGWDRPDPLLQMVVDRWEGLPDEVRSRIIEMVGDTQNRGIGNSYKRVGRPKRK